MDRNSAGPGKKEIFNGVQRKTRPTQFFNEINGGKLQKVIFSGLIGAAHQKIIFQWA
jgi:hypothetical protein